MSYNYHTEHPSLFTEEGMKLTLQIRSRVEYLLKEAGAFTAESAWKDCTGSTWQFAAVLDYLVERGEIVECKRDCWGQHRVFTAPFKS